MECQLTGPGDAGRYAIDNIAMNSKPIRFTISSLLIAVAFIAAILAAYSRGNYLLGFATGVTYAVIATLMVILFTRALTHSPVSKLRIAFLVVFSIPMALAFSFPTYINSDFQVFINKQADDRNARAELKELLATDPAFADLRISTTHRKVVGVEIYGSVPTKQNLDRLQTLVFDRCQFVERCFVHWRVRVQTESKTYTAHGDAVFEIAPNNGITMR